MKKFCIKSQILPGTCLTVGRAVKAIRKSHLKIKTLRLAAFPAMIRFFVFETATGFV